MTVQAPGGWVQLYANDVIAPGDKLARNRVEFQFALNRAHVTDKGHDCPGVAAEPGSYPVVVGIQN